MNNPSNKRPQSKSDMKDINIERTNLTNEICKVVLKMTIIKAPSVTVLELKYLLFCFTITFEVCVQNGVSGHSLISARP